MLTYEQKVTIALKHLKRIESERLLLKGHFNKIAKEHGVKVTDLKIAYNA